MTGSQALLCRMVDNVLDNAIGHNRDGGWISVTTGADGHLARLVVETGGDVLDAGQVAQLAQPFRRLGADRTGSDHGSGLGLSIVEAIAAAHGGTLGLRARPEGGLRVSIGLPLAPAGRLTGAGVPAMRVLVVEDSRSLADVLVEGLRDQGMAVDAARDGLEAAAKLDVNSYDVVVLDRDLPGIHGDTLCQMITEQDDRVMVLMLTAADSPGDRVSGLGLGADDYLAKPFHFPELVLRIRALARRQPSARARILRAAGIELDPCGARSPATGGQLDLSVKEFAVLEALLRAGAGLPVRRGPARTGLGRAGRPVHQHRHGHHRPAAAQAGRSPGDHHHPGRRVPHRRRGCRAVPAASPSALARVAPDVTGHGSRMRYRCGPETRSAAGRPRCGVETRWDVA